MDSAAKRLLKNGFLNPAKKREFNERFLKSGKKSRDKFIESLSDSDAEGYADEEKMEIERLAPPVLTGYPKPVNAFRLFFESYSMSIEEMYFWMLHHIRQDQGFSKVTKISDVFAAAELSSIAGTLQQRLAAQQEKAANYLKGISDMVKGLFQIVREIRILKERLDYYEKSKLSGSEGKAADIALKGIWVDLVEGGAKTPTSVYGIAQQVGFVTLPDLFFRTRVEGTKLDMKKIDEEVAKWDVNPKVKEVLSRKLFQFYEWREKTYDELTARQKFQLKYLRQHYNTIRLYMGWVKPYLKTIRRMGAREKMFTSAELIAAFETSVIELEFLAQKQAPVGPFYPVILAHFDYRTSPSMSYSQEYQRGPIHVGQAVMTMRSYTWTKEQIEAYQRYREEEDIELLKDIDETLKATLESLGDEIKQYLEEAGEVIKKEEEEKPPEKKTPLVLDMLDPFVSIFKGFGEAFGMHPSELFKQKKKGPSEFELEQQRSGAEKAIKFSLFQAYKNYKKAHQFLSW